MDRIKSRVHTLTLQHCSILCSAAESLNTVQPISQPFLNGFSWNFAWWLSRLKGSSLQPKQWAGRFLAEDPAQWPILKFAHSYTMDEEVMIIIWICGLVMEVAKNIYVEWGMFNLGRANPQSCILGGFVSNVGFTSQSFVQGLQPEHGCFNSGVKRREYGCSELRQVNCRGVWLLWPAEVNCGSMAALTKAR